jgi:uncharacterized SAM-dependent methyltransferase
MKRGRVPRSARRREEILYYLRNKNIPIKYEYIGKGAKRFDRLTRSARYISQSELGLLQERSNSIMEPIGRVLAETPSMPITIIDVGCGNGEKAVVILDWIFDRFPGSRIRYVPLDISSEMIGIARDTVSHAFNSDAGGRLETSSRVVDFEEENLLERIWPFRRVDEGINLFLFLGNTLGNLRKSGQERVLSNIARAMGSNDWLLLGVEVKLSQVSRALLQVYKDDLVIDFLSTALESLGIKPRRRGLEGHGVIVPEITRDKNVEIRFKFTGPQIVVQNGTKLSFRTDDYVTLARSERFEQKHVNSLIRNAGLVVDAQQRTDSGSVVILAHVG